MSANLPNYSTKTLWMMCVEVSDEPAQIKAVLKTVGHWFDQHGSGASMTVAQLCRDCSMSESTAHRILRGVRDVWLRVEFNRGHKHERGRSNLYHAALPEAWVELALERLRSRRTRGPQIVAKGVKTAPRIGAKAVGSRVDLAPVHTSKTVEQKRETSTSSLEVASVPVETPTNVIDFAAAARRLRATPTLTEGRVA